MEEKSSFYRQSGVFFTPWKIFCLVWCSLTCWQKSVLCLKNQLWSVFYSGAFISVSICSYIDLLIYLSGQAQISSGLLLSRPSFIWITNIYYTLRIQSFCIISHLFFLLSLEWLPLKAENVDLGYCSTLALLAKLSTNFKWNLHSNMCLDIQASYVLLNYWPHYLIMGLLWINPTHSQDPIPH